MKNTKIMAVLLIMVVAVLFIGGASAQNPVDVNKTAANAPEIGAGTYQLMNGLTPVAEGIVFTGVDTTTKLTTEANGIITISATTKAQRYSNETNQYNFTVIPTPGVTVTLPTTDSYEVGDTVTVTVSYLGNFQGKNVTVTFGDGYSETKELTNAVDAPAELSIEHMYATAGTYRVYVTTDAGNYEPWSGYVTIIPAIPTADVNAHDSAFVYETVNVTNDTQTVNTLYFYSSDATPTLIRTITSDGNGIFNLLDTVVDGHYGAWYAKPISEDGKLSTEYITIWYPEIALKAELTTGANGATSGDSIDGKTINKNTEVSFLINAPNVGPAEISAVKIVFTTPAKGKTTTFGGKDFANIPLKSVQTLAGYTKAGNDATAGTWTAQAEFISPVGFKDNAEKTNTISFTLKSTTLSITADKDSVVRSNPFTVTISGDSNMDYRVYIENAVNSDANPSILANQSGYQKDYLTWTDDAGNVIGAVFKTDATGARTVQFNTVSDTTDKTYTIRVEKVSDDSDYDKVDVKVVKGAITISASGDGSYYIGEEIKLTGTNTDSKDVFLFVTGPNLDYADGVILKLLSEQRPASEATNPVSVNTDNTWEYKWDTSKISLDAGAYTVYATSRLTNGKSSGEVKTESTYGKFDGTDYWAVKLSDSEYATASINLKKPFLSAVPSGTVVAKGSINLKKPFLSAVPSGTVVAKGDKIYIRGTAEGDPSKLMIYIFGPNFYQSDSITVEDDGTYEKKIEVGSTWASNQYYVVIEHPMENGDIDVWEETYSDGKTILYIPNADGSYSPQSSFVVDGSGKLQSSNAQSRPSPSPTRETRALEPRSPSLVRPTSQLTTRSLWKLCPPPSTRLTRPSPPQPPVSP